VPESENAEKKESKRAEQPNGSAFKATSGIKQANKQKTKRKNRTKNAKGDTQISPTPTPEVTSVTSLWMQTWSPTIINALLLLVVTVQAYIYRQQWKVMKRQGDVAEKSIEDSRKARIADNRAWVWIKNAKLAKNLQSDPPANSIIITLENSGNSPARNVTVRWHSAYRESEPISPLGIDAAPSLPPTVIPSHGTSDVEALVVRWSADERNSVFDGPTRLYVWGWIEYEDVFGQRRVSQFSIFNPFVNVVEFAACEHNNTVE
jgi:hypothetical protein